MRFNKKNALFFLRTPPGMSTPLHTIVLAAKTTPQARSVLSQANKKYGCTSSLHVAMFEEGLKNVDAQVPIFGLELVYSQNLCSSLIFNTQYT